MMEPMSLMHSLFKLSELDATDNVALQSLYKSTLLEPIEDFLSRPKKNLRYELIQLGYRLAHESATGKILSSAPETSPLQLFSDVVEMLHSGSLIVDDIEDQSKMRRGRETLHELYGVPLALNAGNWLYFWPMVLIQRSSLTESLKQKAIAECHHTLLLAHTGQALDIGAPLHELPKHHLSEVILKTLELKSGALAALSMKLGALSFFDTEGGREHDVAFAPSTLGIIHRFGNHFGQLLQMYDDIGNLTSASNPQKRFEDLRLRRPTFIWTVLADALPEEEYQAFMHLLLKTPNKLELSAIIEDTLVEKGIAQEARARAESFQKLWIQELFEGLPRISTDVQHKILGILERLSHAY